MKRLSKKQRAEAEALLENCRALQHAFWDALGELEDALGVEIESTNDLEGVNIDDLRKGS